MQGRPVTTEEKIDRFWRWLIHRRLLQDRDLMYKDIANELGVRRQLVGQYFSPKGGPGGTERLADRIDQAITEMSKRRGTTPPPAVRVVSPVHPDGLPDVELTSQAREFVEWLEEARTRDLSKVVTVGLKPVESWDFNIHRPAWGTTFDHLRRRA